MENEPIKNTIADESLETVTGGAAHLETTMANPGNGKIKPGTGKKLLDDFDLLKVNGGVLATPVEEETPSTPAFTPAYGSVTTYVVMRGDTLSGIALRYRTTVSALQNLNHIANPDLITEGATLLIPRR